jgi:molecular chaperone DnaK
MTPYIRDRIGQVFGGRIAAGVDPMSAVVRGAALYSATAGLDARPAQTAVSPQKGLAVRIEHQPVTSDPEPYVVGKFLPGPGEQLPSNVHLRREDGFTGPDASVGTEGGFVLQASLMRFSRNNFSVIATDSAGRDVPLAKSEFTIIHGISISDPPLSRCIGVALADDSVHVYFKKGTTLPARRTVVHQSAKSVPANSNEDVLSVPIVQGEFHRAHRNCLIGSLAIRGVRADLPMGSRVEVTLSLDRSGQMHARADIPAIGQTFDDIIHILVPTASLETFEKELETVDARSARDLKRVFLVRDAASARNLNQVPGLLAEAKSCLEAVRGGDDDAGQRLRRLLLEINGILDSVDQALEWPDLVQEAEERIETAVAWVSAWGTESEKALLDQALTAARAAIDSRDALELDRRVKTIRTLTNAAYARDPRSVFYSFDWYSQNITSATDIPRAVELLNKGRIAYEQSDAETLKTINAQLYRFFPGTDEDRKKSFESGVR